jgi:hypothetical protein
MGPISKTQSINSTSIKDLIEQRNGEVCFYLGRGNHKLSIKTKQNLEAKSEEEKYRFLKKIENKKSLLTDLRAVITPYITKKPIAAEHLAKVPEMVEFFKVKTERNWQKAESKEESEKLLLLMNVCDLLEVIRKEHASTSQ